MRKLVLTCVVVGAVLLSATHASLAGVQSAPILVIANKSVEVAKVSLNDIRPIFQTKKNTWPDGSTARPFNLPENTGLRTSFDAAVLGLDPDRVARYWIDRKIRGGERPPPTAPTVAVMLKVIGKTPGAVGYVDAVSADSTVKVVARIVNGEVVAP
jgi:hypothetical protein